MAEFQGQTDNILKIQVKSTLVYCRWGAAEVSTGGNASLEVLTALVGEGANIKIAIKDLEGNAVDNLTGKILSNQFRLPYKTKANKTGAIYAEVELPDHNLKGKTSKLGVTPPVTFENLKWLDAKDKAITEVTERDQVKLTADVKGLRDGAMVDFQVIVDFGHHTGGEKMGMVCSSAVKGNKAEVIWKADAKKNPENILTHADLAKDGLEYVQPTLTFEVSSMGVKAVSKEVKLIHNMVLLYQVSEDNAGVFEGKKISVVGPDGKKADYTIPANGRIEIEKSLPGLYQVDNTEIRDML